jgi:hypothetical protein
MRIPDEHFRQGIQARLGHPVREEDYLAFVEPYEGQKHLADIRSSLRPEEIVTPIRPKPLKTKLVAFPADISGPAAVKAGLKSLHRLLATVITAPGRTHALQETLKRRKPNILLILWVFGHLGDVVSTPGTSLVIDSVDCGDRRECNTVIRKRDNSLQIPARQAAAVLDSYGVHMDHTPIGGEHWIVSLSFDRKAGGPRALKALQYYVKSLISKHGEPVYTKASRYKGKAFELFSRADMRMFAR